MTRDYLLEGWLWCRRCQSFRQPAIRSVTEIGCPTRVYTCVGTACTQAPTDADWVEQQATLAAMVHMFGVLHGEEWQGWNQFRHERRRWHGVNSEDKRAVIRTAFSMVEIIDTRKIKFIWRHRQEGEGVAC